MRQDLWNALLDAEMNVAYWDAITRRTIGRERIVKGLLALLSSGTAANLILTLGDQVAWRIVATTAAIISIGLSVGDFPGQIKGMTELKQAWAEFGAEYLRVWLRSQSGAKDAELLPEFAEIRKREAKETVDECKYPRVMALLRRCQAEVRRSRGI